MNSFNQRKTRRYVALLIVLVANLVILSVRIPSLPWHSSGNLGTIGLFVTTPLLVLLALAFARNGLSSSRNQVKLAIPLVALLINMMNLLLATSNLKTDLSLLITALLIISTFSISYPRAMSY